MKTLSEFHDSRFDLVVSEAEVGYVVSLRDKGLVKESSRWFGSLASVYIEAFALMCEVIRLNYKEKEQ